MSMKARELRRMLDAVDGDSYVTMRLGNSSDYRDRCSKIQLMAGDTLEIMIPTRVEIEEDGDGGFNLTIVLEEGGWSCDPEDNKWADEFDRRFGLIEKCDSGVAAVYGMDSIYSRDSTDSTDSMDGGYGDD